VHAPLSFRFDLPIFLCELQKAKRLDETEYHKDYQVEDQVGEDQVGEVEAEHNLQGVEAEHNLQGVEAANRITRRQSI
jgi:hypothetical protein